MTNSKYFVLFALAAMVFAEKVIDPESVDVVSDKTVKNDDFEVEGPTQGCYYIRSFTVRKRLEQNPNKDPSQQHSYIYYHCVECLNIDLHEVREPYVTFSYDDQNLSEDAEPTLIALPEGCPAPILPRTKTPCENGIELGKHLVSDVTEIVTKEIVENPLNLDLDPNDPNLNTEKLTEVTVELDTVSKEIAEALKKLHDDVDEPSTPDDTEITPEGVEIEKYSFPDSEVVVTKLPPKMTGTEPGPGTEPTGGAGTSPTNGTGSEPTGGSESGTDNGPGTGNEPETFPEPGTDSTPVDVMHMPPYSGTVVDEDGKEVVVAPDEGLGPHRTTPGETMLPKDLSEMKPGTYHSKKTKTIKDPKDPNKVVGYEIVEVKITSDPRTHETKTWTKGPNEEDPVVYEGYIHRVPAVVDASKISEARYPPVGEPIVTVVDNPMRFTQPEPPKDFQLPPDLFDKIGNVSEIFTDAVEEIVTHKAECLLDKIFHQKKYEIELVCSKTAAEGEKSAILKNELIRKLFCNGGDCADVYQGWVDDMITATANGQAAHFKIDKKTYIGELTAGPAA